MIFVSFTGCRDDTKQQLSGFSEYLDDVGYSFYNPPRTDRGPASVFRFTRAESGKNIISPVCKKIFEHVPVNESKLSLPSEKSVKQLKLGLAVSLIEDLLTAPPKLEADWESNSNVNVNFSNVSSVYINEEDLYNAEGVARSITPSCFSALKRLSKQGELNDEVFIVQESLRVNSMSYVLAKSSSANSDINIDIKKLLNFKPDVDFQIKDNISLEINEPRYIAFRAFLLKKYIDTGLTGSGSAILKAEPLTLKEINHRLNK